MMQAPQPQPQVTVNDLLQVIGGKEMDLYLLRTQLMRLAEEKAELESRLKESGKDTPNREQ